MPFGNFGTTAGGGGGASTAKEIRTNAAAWAAFTMTGVGALPGNGAGWQSTLVANPNQAPAALILLSLQLAVAPTNGLILECFLIRADNAIPKRTDNAGPTAAALTVQNARMIGALQCNATVGPFTEVFDTSALGPLGDNWGIILRNSTNQALAAIGLQTFEYQYYVPKIQA